MTFTQVADKYIVHNKVSRKRKMKNFVKSARNVIRLTQCNPKAVFQFFNYNTLKEIVKGDMIIPTPHCVFDISKSARIVKHGKTVLGEKLKFKKSKLETRLFVGKNATLELGDGILIGYGADIEVFDGATLKICGQNASNVGLTIICGDRMEIGRYAIMGRNVTIRDNNGKHYLSLPGYRDSRPVVIGEKVWLCEQSTVMPGVKVGDGSIVAARSLVTGNVPAHTLVSGNPCQVTDEEVIWKS